jgi:hypothetical protein
MRRHKLLSVRAGDSWEIIGHAKDTKGRPLDITGVSVEWALTDSAGVRKISPADTVVTITNGPVGDFMVSVPSTVTALLLPGDYEDVCRVTSASYRDSIWAGPIKVHRNVFA